MQAVNLSIASADNAASLDCPAKKQLVTQIEEKTQQLQDTQKLLLTLIAGQNSSEVVPPSALFTVDLLNEEAVARRVEELSMRVSMESPPTSEIFSGLLPCLKKYTDLVKRVTEAQDLEHEIDVLRLQFLSLPRDRLVAFINAQKAVVAHSEVIQQLEQEKTVADLQKMQALKLMEEARERAKTAASIAQRELSAQRALLEKTREDLATIKGRWVESLQSRVKIYQAYAENLSLLNAVLNKESSAEELKKAFAEEVLIWRQLVDGIFANITDISKLETVPTMHPVPGDLLEQLKEEPEAVAYLKAYDEVHKQYDELIALRDERFEKERDNAYRLLLQAGKLRSELMKKTISMGDTTPLSPSKANFEDLSREIRVVPYRWIAIAYSKWMDIRRTAGAGLEGIVEIVKQGFVLAFVVALPFVIFFLLNQLTERLNNLRRNLLRKQYFQEGKLRQVYGNLALWIQRVNPYLPWVMMLLGLGFAGQLIALTDLTELSGLLPYAEYYIWYRIFLNIIVAMVGLVAYADSTRAIPGMRYRVQKTAKKVGRFFLIAMIILHATESVVGEALVYQIVYWVMVYFGAIVCFYAAHLWQTEIVRVADNMLPQMLAKIAIRYCQGWTSWLASLPVIILIIMYYLWQWILEVANQLDFFKRIGAELFRRRIESVVVKGERGGVVAGQSLPEDYLEHFDLGAPSDPELLFEPTNGVVDEVLAQILGWLDGKAVANCMAVYGSKGSGKTSLLNIVERRIKDVQLYRLVVPPKLCTKEAVYRFFSMQLGLDLTAETVETKITPPDKKFLVLVDEAQNMFLSTLGGFEGYKAFLELIGADTKHIFWLASFNHRSWDYLCSVFKGHQYSGQVLALPPFTEDDIQQLIMTRHRRTPFKLSYDTIIRATQNSDEYSVMERIEQQFFRLLWGQSKGNPRTALVLWLSALRRSSGNVLRVGIPQYSQLKDAQLFSDDVMFVYAAIMRHENLSASELVLTTGLPMVTIKDAIKIGLESDVIFKADGERYRVAPVDQYALEQLLIRKNFIYG